ncbi:MAG TPA: hypothetical protein VN203_27960, partial [Candidatus Acidoferrum sp.]|nr:hypothetical protein [Candidatus Acidoferrum sp.]
EVIDTEADLNAYAKVENEGSCCSPVTTSLPVVETSCCSGQPAEDNLHRRLMDLLQRYNVNDFATSTKRFFVAQL